MRLLVGPCDAETLVGASRDSRSTYIDQLLGRLRVEHQRLWIEIVQHLDNAKPSSKR